MAGESAFPPPPEGYKAWGEYCAANHKTDPFCAENVPTSYHYDISFAANLTFTILFGISLLGFIATYLLTRRGLVFSAAFSMGVLLEILGYGGRIMSWDNPWGESGFFMQIICLTIGPAFLAAGIYLCLRRIVSAFGAENSRIKPQTYTRFFIPCDVVALILQAAGGAIAATNDDPINNKTGDYIMIAGLVFQVVILLVFMTCSADFALNVWRRQRKYGADRAFDQSEAARRVRGSFLFKTFLGALALSTVCIFVRSIFRVAELSGGWDGPLMARQDLFIGFEGVLIVVACFILNVFHPSVCFKELMDGDVAVDQGYNRTAKSAEDSESDAVPLSQVNVDYRGAGANV